MLKSTLSSISLVQIVTAMLVCVGIVYLSESNSIQKERLTELQTKNEHERLATERLEAPASDWFLVDQISVADFNVYEDPIMIVDRTIKKSFTAEWLVELKRVRNEGIEFVCSSSNKNHYDSTAKLPEPLKLSWWMSSKSFSWEKDCANLIVEGQYILITTWVIIPDDTSYPEKKVTKSSNIFDIYVPE